MELLEDNDPRKPGWLAQAHNLLFAPVLATDEHAQQAAELLTQQRQPVPVFTQASLQQAANDPGAALMGAVVGYESLAVKALLNPRFIEDWKQQLEAELIQLRKSLTELDQQLADLDPQGVTFQLAKSAKQAQEENAEKTLEQQQASLEQDRARQVQLDDWLAPKSRKLIRSAEHFLNLGGKEAMGELEASIHQLSTKLEQATQALSRLDDQLSGEHRKRLGQAEQFLQEGGPERLQQVSQDIERHLLKQQQLAESLEQCREALTSFTRQVEQLQGQVNSIYAPGEKDRLQALDNYLQEGGPAFMAKAESTRQSLENQREHAQHRASLKFDRVRAYLNARDHQGDTAALKKQIAELKSTIKRTAQEQDDKEATIQGIQKEQPRQLNAMPPSR